MINVSITSYSAYCTDTLTQWDVNQKLKISGLSANPTLLFSNKLSIVAEPVVPTISGNDYICDIPNKFLQSIFPLYVYVRIRDDIGATNTIAKIKIPIIPSKKPEDYEYVDNVAVISYEDLLTKFAIMDRDKANKEDLLNLSNLLNDKLDKPLTGDGTVNQILKSNGDGTTSWVDMGTPEDEQVETAVSKWLEDHPEATTTVGDGTITMDKLAEDVKTQMNNSKELEEIKEYIGFGLLVLSESSLIIKDGMTKKFSVKLGYAPESNQKVNISVDKERLTLDKTELIFTPDNFSVEQVITITDKGDPDESDDTANITVSAVVNASSFLIGKIIPVTIKELAYTNTGLIADYDAMKNTRAGYDENSTVWEDLSGHNYDIDLTIKGETSGVISLNKDMTYDSTKNGFNWTGTSLIIREENSQGASVDIEIEVLTTGFSVNLVVKCEQINGYGSIARVINSPNYLATEQYYQNFCCIPANGNTVQGLNGFGGNALRKPIGDSINKNQIMLTYTEDVNENCSMYINGQLTTAWKNGDNYGNHPSYIIYFLQFFKNIKAEVSHMSIYNKVLTSQEIIDTFDYFDKKYGLSNIQGVALNITPSGTVYPYTEIPFTASVIPNNKENDTDVVITSESDNAEVIE